MISVASKQQILFVFSQAHPDFREAEFEAICSMCGISPVPKFLPNGCHLQSLAFPNGQSDALRVLERAMLVKQAFAVIAEGEGHERVLAELARQTFADIDSPDQSWCLQVRTQRRKRSNDYIQSIVKRYTPVLHLERAPICLCNPRNLFVVIELYKEQKATKTAEDKPEKVFFAKFVSVSGRGHLKTLYSLSRRRYIGNSTMDPELAFIQTNLATARPGSIVLDPFCGTGGLMLPSAHFGAYVIGVEIKWDVARAKGKSSRAGERWLCSDHSIRENFDQYGLDGGHFLGVALADSSRHDLWHFSVAHGLLDAIITDPPYGIRERGQRLGKVMDKSNGRKGQRKSESNNANGAKFSAEAENLSIGTEDRIIQSGDRFPEKQKYAMSNVFLDLMDLAVRLLRVGGRLAFWFPVCRSEYSDRCLPRSKCLRLVHNCEQPLTRDSARRLLVYEKCEIPKLEDSQLEDKAYFEVDCYANETFRHKVFNNKDGERMSRGSGGKRMGGDGQQ